MKHHTGRVATILALLSTGTAGVAAAGPPTGHIVKFDVESVSGTAVNSSAQIRIKTTEGSSLDWAATVLEIATSVVSSGGAPAVDVKLFHPNGQGLAVANYGPDKATSPWPDPLSIFTQERIITPREDAYSEAFDKLLDEMRKRGVDPDKADKDASAVIARKYKLPGNWQRPSPGYGPTFHNLDQLHVDLNGRQDAIDGIVECVKDANFIGALTACPNNDHDVRNASEALSQKARAIVVEPGAHVMARVVGHDAYVRFTLEPWQLTAATMRGALYTKTAELVPAAFELSAQISNVVLQADAGFKDIKGHSSTARYATLKFTRATSASINWKEIDQDNIPRLADEYKSRS